MLVKFKNGVLLGTVLAQYTHFLKLFFS